MSSAAQVIPVLPLPASNRKHAGVPARVQAEFAFPGQNGPATLPLYGRMSSSAHLVPVQVETLNCNAEVFLPLIKQRVQLPDQVTADHKYWMDELDACHANVNKLAAAEATLEQQRELAATVQVCSYHCGTDAAQKQPVCSLPSGKDEHCHAEVYPSKLERQHRCEYS